MLAQLVRTKHFPLKGRVLDFRCRCKGCFARRFISRRPMVPKTCLGSWWCPKRKPPKLFYLQAKNIVDNHAMINDAWCKIQTLNVYIRMINQLMKMILRDSLEGNGCPTHIIMHMVDIQVVPTWDEIYTCFIDSTAHSMSWIGHNFRVTNIHKHGSTLTQMVSSCIFGSKCDVDDDNCLSKPTILLSFSWQDVSSSLSERKRLYIHQWLPRWFSYFSGDSLSYILSPFEI